MVTVNLYAPGTPIPTPEPKDKNALYFNDFARREYVRQMEIRAARDGGRVFVATEDDKLVAQGVTTIRKVIADEAGSLLLSDSHARHEVAPGFPRPTVGQTYEVAIDPVSSVILTARAVPQQPTSAPQASTFAIDPFALPEIQAGDARAFFSAVGRQPHIPFQFPGDGCWARAHEMCRLIETYLDQDPRDVTGKVWNIESVDVRTDNNPDCEVHWFFHVAPVVKVAGELLVIDPSLFGEPVPVADWLTVQRGTSPNLYYTSRFAYNRAGRQAGLFVSEAANKTEIDLRTCRDLLADQIYSSGPLPYRCPAEAAALR